MAKEMSMPYEVPRLSRLLSHLPTYPAQSLSKSMLSDHLRSISCLVFADTSTVFKSKTKYTAGKFMGVFHARWMDKAGWD